MAEMTKEKWIKAGLEIAEHLKALQKITAENGMDMLSIAVFGNRDDISYATFIDGSPHDEDRVYYEVRVRNGKATLCVDQEPYYIQT